MKREPIPLALRPVPARILSLLGILCLVPSFGCFALAATFFSRGRANDDREAAFSAGAISVVFMFASFGALLLARRKPQMSPLGSMTPVMNQRRFLWLSIVSFPLMLLLLWAAIVGLYESFLLCNQEYLHWFEATQRSFGDVSVKSMIIEKVIFSTVSLAGALLLLYSILFLASSSFTFTPKQDKQLEIHNLFAPPEHF